MPDSTPKQPRPRASAHTSARRRDARAALDRDLERLERRSSEESFWHSLAVLGTVGWSIALPSALGAWFGHVLDRRWDTNLRFTLGLLFLGVALGTYTAWRAIAAESTRRRGAQQNEDRGSSETKPRAGS